MLSFSDKVSFIGLTPGKCEKYPNEQYCHPLCRMVVTVVAKDLRLFILFREM